MSLKLPKCDCCSHLRSDTDDKMCCDAFPNGIPSAKITWGNKDAECANGIKYEARHGNVPFVPAPDSILAKMHRI